MVVGVLLFRNFEAEATRADDRPFAWVPQVRPFEVLKPQHGDELPEWYAAADCFVMPSRSETWGMAMNEAAAAGLPLVASEAPGAGYDLIDDGVNGFRVPVEDVEALRAALVRVATDESFRERARPRTLELARGYTPEAWAESVVRLAGCPDVAATRARAIAIVPDKRRRMDRCCVIEISP